MGELIQHKGTRVRNIVEWVNPLIRHPFNLKEGRTTQLGIFSTPNSKGIGLVFTKTWQSHSLSLATSRNTFLHHQVAYEDEFGNTYYNTNLKGGVLAIDGKVFQYPNYSLGSQYGAVKEEMTSHYRFVSQELLKLGVRITPDVAHIRLFEYPGKPGNEWEKLVAKIAGTPEIMKKFPGTKCKVLVVRAFGCKGRAENAGDPELLKEAMEVAKKEIGAKRLSEREYLDWFSKTLAKSLAIMHANGWAHGLVTPHNVTLDARLTDLGTVEKVPNFSTHDLRERGLRGAFIVDISSSRDVLRKFCEMRGLTSGDNRKYCEKFEKNYYAELANALRHFYHY